MKKRYIIEDLCCANCAAKMEAAIGKLEGVNSASINFLTQKLTLDADEAQLEAILDQAEAIVKKIEPDCIQCSPAFVCRISSIPLTTSSISAADAA